MEYDTAGNEIIRISPNCDCGLTGGCEKCNPFLERDKSDEVEMDKKDDQLI